MKQLFHPIIHPLKKYDANNEKDLIGCHFCFAQKSNSFDRNNDSNSR